MNRSSGAMGSLFSVLCCWLCTAPALGNTDDKPRSAAIAVFPFKVLNPDPNFAHFGEGAADAMINHFVRDGALQMVEESQIEVAIQSLARNQTGLFEEENAFELGKMVDARFVVIGSVDVVPPQVAVSARVLEVETRQLIVSDRVYGALTDAFALYEELGRRTLVAILRHLTLRVTGETGDSADAVAVQKLLSEAKRYDPNFGGDNLPMALAAYRKAVLRDPNHAVARFALGQALVQSKSYGDAKRNLELALSLKPDYAIARTWLGYTEDKLGDPLAGRAQYELSLEADPNLALTHYWLGANLANANEWEKALTHAELATKLGDNRAGTLLQHIRQNLARRAQARDPAEPPPP